MRNPPILVSVLGFFAGVAGMYWIYVGLRVLGFDWFGALGDLAQFEQSGLWGWFALITGIIWFAAAVGLWALRPWAWMFAMVVAGLAILEACLWLIEAPGTGIALSSAILPILIIAYLNSREVKAQFLGDPGQDA